MRGRAVWVNRNTPHVSRPTPAVLSLFNTGDAPYGTSTPVRAALGLSLLGAYPSGGKRTYRIDLAVPLNPAPGASKFEVRLSSVDRTRGIWREPRDVASLRTGAMPATLLKW